MSKRGRLAAVAVAFAATMAAAAPAQAAERRVAVNDAQTCAIDSKDTGRCWGVNADVIPNSVGTIKTVAVDIGSACAVRTDDAVACWQNVGVGANYPVPADLGPVSSLSVSDRNGCAQPQSGNVKCWGDPNTGVNTTPSAGFRVLDQGGNTACGAKGSDYTVVCWGDAPAAVPNVQTSELSVGGKTDVCGIDRNTEVLWCADDADVAAAPPELGDVTDVSVLPGGIGGCVVKKSDSSLVCFGGANEGQLKPPAGIGAVKSVELSNNTGCAVKANGYIACWGDPQFQKGASPATPGPAPAATAKVGTIYSHELTSSLGTPGGEFKVSAGTLPPGLAIVRNTVLEGTPTKAGTYKFTLVADNDVFDPASKEFTITVTSGSAPPADDKTAPVLSDVSLSQRRGVLTIEFTSSEAGTLGATFAKCKGRGTSLRKKCKKVASKANPFGGNQAVVKGANTITLSTKDVAPRFVKLRIAVADAAGNFSKVVSASVKVKR